MLLSRDGTAKIADVGLARILTQKDTAVSGGGAFEWAPPEVNFPSATCPALKIIQGLVLE